MVLCVIEGGRKGGREGGHTCQTGPGLAGEEDGKDDSVCHRRREGGKGGREGVPVEEAQGSQEERTGRMVLGVIVAYEHG